MPQTLLKLPPAAGLPLLEEAIAEGHENLSCQSVMDTVLLEWVDRTLLVLDSIEGTSGGVRATLILSGNKLQGGGRAGALAWRDTLQKILDSLALQAKIFRAASGAPAATAASAASAAHGASAVAATRGTTIFIGHGRDPAWLKLQRFIEKRLHLEADDFDGVFAAGKTVTERLSEMLDSAAFAFLVMTAEDTVTPEEIRARQNVVHEVGLFQGRLGFNRAIVLIEEGCTSFSNLAGIVYISFPKGNIDAIFEKVRGTLEAASLAKSPTP